MDFMQVMTLASLKTIEDAVPHLLCLGGSLSCPK